MSGQIDLNAIKNSIETGYKKIEDKIDLHAGEEEEARQEVMLYIKKLDAHVEELKTDIHKLKADSVEQKEHNNKQDRIINVHTVVGAIIIFCLMYLWFKSL